MHAHIETETVAHTLMHVSSLISVAALALRGQLRLRIVLLVSIIFNTAYHCLSGPNGGLDWQSLFWNIIAIAINLWTISRILLDRTHVGLTPEQERLFTAFGVLTPGEFRQVLKMGAWVTADATTTLTTEGQVPDRLYYILDGDLDVVKGERRIRFHAPTFIGEIAFLKATPASATVTLEPGARYLVWDTGKLSQHLDRLSALKGAITRLISADMATKVARS